MPTQAERRVTGILLVFVPFIFTLCFALLSSQFAYPEILRQPTGSVLQRFALGGPTLIGIWYTLTLSALLFIPVALLLSHMLGQRNHSIYLAITTTFGIVAGLVQTLGFIRWPFLVPYLSQLYTDPGASEASRAAVVVTFEAFHRYAGMALGEHLGYLCTSVWTLLIAQLLVRRAEQDRLQTWLGYSGIILAGGIALGLAEPLGLAWAGAINAISYLIWAVWLMLIGASLLFRQSFLRTSIAQVA